MAVRTKVAGSTEELLDNLLELDGLDDDAWAALPDQDNVWVWEAAGGVSKFPGDYYVRVAAEVLGSPEEVGSFLTELGQYSDWARPSIAKSLSLKDYGPFFRLAQLQVQLGDSACGCVLGALHLEAASHRQVVGLVSIPPAAIDLPSSGAKWIELNLAGFVAQRASDAHKTVLSLVLSAKPWSKKVANAPHLVRTLAIHLLNSARVLFL